jgi:hypothetical protein
MKRLIGKTAYAAALVIGLFLASTGSSRAYIDPGTGSYVLQLAAAGVFAALVTVKTFWKSIRSSLVRRTGERHKE